MSKYATKKRYQVGDYWLAQRNGSEAWYRMWFDKSTRQTRRISLGTTNFEDAKTKLTEWFILNQTKPISSFEDVTLAEVFSRFYEQHGKTLVSSGEVARSLRYWLDFHTTATVKEALQPHKQAQFRQLLAKTKGLAPNSVRRVLADGKSALNWAWKRGEVDALPYIELVKVPRPEPKGRPLNVDEVVQLFKTATSPHLKVFMAFMLATAGRTGAVVDLTYSQIDLTNNLIHLNPAGRQQNKKYRPTVRLPEQLREYVEHHRALTPNGPVIAYDGKGVTTVRRSWRNTKKQSGLTGNVQTYSFRHTAARWLRQKSVPAWEVSAQLGHKAPEYSTTEIYAPFDPAYLNNSVEAIDDFLAQVACQLRAKTMSEYLLKL